MYPPRCIPPNVSTWLGNMQALCPGSAHSTLGCPQVEAWQKSTGLNVKSELQKPIQGYCSQKVYFHGKRFKKLYWNQIKFRNVTWVSWLPSKWDDFQKHWQLGETGTSNSFFSLLYKLFTTNGQLRVFLGECSRMQRWSVAAGRLIGWTREAANT